MDAFKDAQAVIQLRDTVTHTLVGKGSATVTYIFEGTYPYTAPMKLTYTIEVQAKPGRYRIKVYDAVMNDNQPVYNAPCCYGGCDWGRVNARRRAELDNAHNRMCGSIYGKVGGIPASLKTAMQSSPEDW